MIQKLSARQPSLEIRLKMLKEIASEIGVTLHLEEDAHVIVEVGKMNSTKQQQYFASNNFLISNFGVHSNIFDNCRRNRISTRSRTSWNQTNQVTWKVLH